MKKILKIFLWALAGIAGFVAMYFAVAWCCSRIAVGGNENQPEEVSIYIRTNGAHTDIVMPVKTPEMDWGEMMPYANNVSQDTVYTYVGIGWGDKGFFLNMPTWDDLTLSLSVKAAFWCSTSAMHATYYKAVAEDGCCRRIVVSREQYARLVEFIAGRFEKDEYGRFINIKTDAAYGLTDAFYEARGKYNLFYTCNTWANDALAAAGQKHCLWTIFDKGIFLKYP